jgi:undecaprenyl phosphate N,N'-diacetylbacillosamine 1-phosphate transferase
MVFGEDAELLAQYLKKNTLGTVNRTSKPVHPRDSFYVRHVKRFLDIMISSVAMLVFLPINLILGICTFFDVGRPILYIQQRPGKDGKLFSLVKFRNMRDAVDSKGYWLPIEERVTKFGRFVRKTSLDELLNFYSILKGDMSLIGPRPLSVFYLDRYSDRHQMRHSVRPGLECPNIQKHGYSAGWQEQFENDIWYVENVSFVIDVKMIVFLFKMVFDSKIRSKKAAEGFGDFIGYDENGIAISGNSVPKPYLEVLDRLKEECT